MTVTRHDNGTIKTIELKHGRILEGGQTWRSNDARNLRAVKIISFHELAVGEVDVIVENIVSKRRTSIDARNFTIGVRGWSLWEGK